MSLRGETDRMRNYCTVFDKNYLVQGVALYRSLLHHADEFTLYALCMDGEACELPAKGIQSSTVKRASH